MVEGGRVVVVGVFVVPGSLVTVPLPTEVVMGPFST